MKGKTAKISAAARGAEALRVSENIICAGFGGQGIMTLGKVLANTGMKKGLNVTWMPSYGAEVRGGTAHAMVRISSSLIGNPRIDEADTAFIMNEPSLRKFEDELVTGGLLILNTSMVKCSPARNDLDIAGAAFTDEAIKLGNVRVANMVAAGLYAAEKKLFTRQDLVNVVEMMAAGRPELIDVNVRAVDRGIELAGE